jgi:hypothetical protein
MTRDGKEHPPSAAARSVVVADREISETILDLGERTGHCLTKGNGT